MAPLTAAPPSATCCPTFMSVTALSTRSGRTREGTIASRTGIPKATIKPSTAASPKMPQKFRVSSATSVAAPAVMAMPATWLPNSSSRRSSRSVRMPA